MRPTALLLAVALLLPACGDDDGDDGTAAVGGAGVPTTESTEAAGGGTDATTSTTTAGGATSTTSTTATSATSAPDGAAAVVLEADGLRVDGELVAFQTGQQEVLDAVAGALGDPTSEESFPECPPGAADVAVFDGGMSLTFQEGAFVGWVAQPGAEATTEAGIGIGSTLAEVRSALEVLNVEETSLGMEFAAEGFYGVLTDDSAQGEVTALFAGANCIFR